MSLERLESRLVTAWTRSLTDIELRLRGLVDELHDEGGILAMDAYNVQQIDINLKRLDDVMSQEMRAALEEQRQVLSDLLDEIREEAEGFGLPDVFSPATGRSIKMLIDGAEADILSVMGSSADEVARALRSSIVGGMKSKDLIAGISLAMGKSKHVAQTVLTTSLHSFHRQVTATHAKELGVEEFGYDGPMDGITREWCRHWVGRRGTAEEIEATANMWERAKQPGPAVTFGGGWNCRHTWIPLVGDRQRKKYKKGPR